jgi:hypothetical protein
MTPVRKYKFDFDEVPSLGTTTEYFCGLRLTLVDVEPYTRKNGETSQILVWQAPDGRMGTSGLKGLGITWRSGQ